MNRWGLFLFLVLAGVVAGGAIAWHQATALPRWYTAQSVPTSQLATAPQRAQQVEQKLKTLYQPQTTVTLSQQEVNDLVTATIDAVGRQARVTPAIKGINTEFDGDQLKAGAVVNLTELQSGQLSRPQKMLLSQAIERVPGLADREVYIGLKSRPKLVNGSVQLDPSTTLQLGNLSLSLQDVARYLDMTPEQLQTRINQALPMVLSGLPVDQIDLQDDKLVLRSSSQQ
jgi:hypothetical protein